MSEGCQLYFRPVKVKEMDTHVHWGMGGVINITITHFTLLVCYKFKNVTSQKYYFKALYICAIRKAVSCFGHLMATCPY